MANLKFSIDAKALANAMSGFKAEVESALEDGVKNLSAQTHAKILEMAQSKLNQTRKMYTDALSYEEISPGVWVVSLDNKAAWIDDGYAAGSMLPFLLKNAKTSKEGFKYKVIPFDHGKPQSQMNPAMQGLITNLKSEMKKQGVGFKKIEYNQDGSPKLGKLHTLNVSSPHPSSVASHPIFSGVTVYQSKGANGKVKRDVMTFRVASEKHPEKFMREEKEGHKFFEKAIEWAEATWANEILPAIYAKFGDGK